MTNGPPAPVSPAAVRNAPAILAVLERVLAPQVERGQVVIEIAAGSGYHATTFAHALPTLTWQPTEADPDACRVIAEVVAASNLGNLRPPLRLDVNDDPWPVAVGDAVLCINMIHISPWESTLALFRGAARLLSADAPLVTYGPYSIDGDFLAQSNIAFDQSLRLRNAAWGIRDVTNVAQVAGESGFHHEETVRMPANNLMLVFRKQP